MMQLKDLCKKENAVYSFGEIELGIKKAMLESGILAMLMTIMVFFFVFMFKGMEIKAFLLLLLFPVGLFCLFAWTTLVLYWTGRTGNYLVIQGQCVDSEYSINPVMKAKNTAFQRRTRFVLETEEGQLYKVLCRRQSELPKQGDIVHMVVSRNTAIQKEELCEMIPDYIFLTSISTKQGNKAKKEKKA